MNILLSNDDGYDAYGIRMLAKHLKKFGNVVIAAPEGERSAVSHATNIKTPISFYKKEEQDGIPVYVSSGNPSDCVRLAIGLLDVKFDLVFSGMNNGYNLGTDVYYSGTVAAAREACIEGIPGIAVSTGRHQWAIAENEIDGILDYIMKNKLYDKAYVLNVNFPEKTYEKSLGIRMSRCGKRFFKSTFGANEEGLYYEVSHTIEIDDNPISDVVLQQQGYVTITPLSLDATDYEILNKMKTDRD